jgi:Sugar (and other) transporter
LPPLILAPATFWLPESPRWLITQQRNEQALQVLTNLHNSPNDPDNTFAHEEYVQIRKQIELEAQHKQSIWSALKQPSMRKRFAIGAMTQYVVSLKLGTAELTLQPRFFLQCSGVLVIVTYQVSIHLAASSIPCKI